MEKVIPILPCSNANELIEFYEYLGFKVLGKFIRSYIVLQFQSIELHFYGTKKILPQANATMCFISVDNVEQIYTTFVNNIKSKTGKIPRNGFPKITKIRDLDSDWRFTLTDPSGNTFYIATKKNGVQSNFFRDIDNKQYSEKFAILYDLVYSKEDCRTANNMLPTLLIVKNELNDLDKAKLLLIILEIQVGLSVEYERTEIESLISENQSDSVWIKIQDKLYEILESQ